MLHKIAMVAPGGYRMRPYLHRLRGVNIGKGAWISQYVYIDEIHPDSVTIGENVSIGLRTSLITHFYWGPRRAAHAAGPIIIEKNCFIGPHCVILPNVKIGQGAVIQAGTVVSRNVPAGMLWGHPKSGPLAKVTVPLTHNSSYDAFAKGLRPILSQAFRNERKKSRQTKETV